MERRCEGIGLETIEVLTPLKFERSSCLSSKGVDCMGMEEWRWWDAGAGDGGVHVARLGRKAEPSSPPTLDVLS